MAYDNRGSNLPGVVADVDLSATPHRFVTIGATGVNLTAAGGRIDAVLDNDPIADQAASLMGPGSTSKVVASEAIAVGDKVGSAANGKARIAVAGDHVIGICVSPAGADLELCSVWIASAPGSENVASAAYVANATAVIDRTLLASASATTLNNNNVLAGPLADLQAAGILG